MKQLHLHKHTILYKTVY